MKRKQLTYRLKPLFWINVEKINKSYLIFSVSTSGSVIQGGLTPIETFHTTYNIDAEQLAKVLAPITKSVVIGPPISDSN